MILCVCVCVFIKWLVDYSVKGESLLNCACVLIKWLMGYSVRGESLFKVFQAGRDLIQEVNCWKDRRGHSSGNPETQESWGLAWEMLVCMSPGNRWFPKLKQTLPALLFRYLAHTCTVLSSIKASPSPPSNLTKELLLPSHHSPLHKLHLMGRSLLWSSNHSSSSRTEISSQLTSWSLQPPISDTGLTVPDHNREVAGTKYKISRYPARSRCHINAKCFLPSSFYPCVSLGGSFEASFRRRDLAGHRGRIPKVLGAPGKSPPLKKAIKDLISYHLPFQLARVLWIISY